MSYTVAVSSSYRHGCPTCMQEAEQVAINAIRDPLVTALALRASARCEHEGGAPQGTPQPVVYASADPRQLPLVNMAATHSDVNGFNPPDPA